ncbi:C4-dicarboxylate TRAP transporter substrate-binding protein [Cellulomonas shaoxiangyii]|uniref:C4-dicarboxylate ABC transporter n=1 Tax=Cellulomonas shaoxiangyii TaxID=2566013 RepID=A0A4P7SN48_9CELL|nr:C4-dicarboxylate TRAP transporter substrate-binding protein [Cellulomonas shaoxiangyii]QCB94023.1 C4-dicarboxylate ABC transporter [Cellulomonas shaoxiangyii]TGY85788.1 C4-dicarboxylate ABC transporter [Cellulomonas shaoxiangyii]
MQRRKHSLVVPIASGAIALALVACSGTAGGGEASGDAEGEKYNLRFNHVLAESEPFHAGFTAWAEAVEERTDGGLTIDVYPAGQLGVEEDIIEQARTGANVGQNTDSARLGMYVEDLAVMNGPYFVEDLDEVQRLQESETVQEMLTQLEEEEGLKVLSFNWVQTHRHFFTNKEINNPDDLAGLRIRTPGSPIWQESIRALGAEPVAMGFGEMYSGIQQGAIDGAELVYANIPGGKLNEVLSHATETGHILLINFEVVSADWFNSLPTEYQEILVEEADKAGLAASETMESEIETIRQELVDAGLTVNENPDVEAFQEAGEAAYETLGLTEVKQAIWSEIDKS